MNEFQQNTQYLEDPPAPVNLHIPHPTEDSSNPRSCLSSYFLLPLALFHCICWLSLLVFCSLPITLTLIANKTDIVQRVMCLHKQCKWKARSEHRNHLCKGCVYAGKEHCYPQRASGMTESKKRHTAFKSSACAREVSTMNNLDGDMKVKG